MNKVFCLHRRFFSPTTFSRVNLGIQNKCEVLLNPLLSLVIFWSKVIVPKNEVNEVKVVVLYYNNYNYIDSGWHLFSLQQQSGIWEQRVILLSHNWAETSWFISSLAPSASHLVRLSDQARLLQCNLGQRPTYSSLLPRLVFPASF